MAITGDTMTLVSVKLRQVLAIREMQDIGGLDVVMVFDYCQCRLFVVKKAEKTKISKWFVG